MGYPNVAAGQRLTAAGLAAMQMQQVEQAEGLTVNNSTTLVNSNLTFEAAANAIYWYRLLASVSTGTTADSKFAWAVPTNGDVVRFTWGLGINGTSANDNTFSEVSMRRPATTTGVQHGGHGTVTTSYHEEGIITAGNGGDVTLQFAQGTATAANTDLTASSRLLYIRIG